MKKEIFTRLKLGAALLVGYAAGAWASHYSTAYSSEYFSVGFLAGVLGTQAAFWLIGQKTRGSNT